MRLASVTWPIMNARRRTQPKEQDAGDRRAASGRRRADEGDRLMIDGKKAMEQVSENRHAKSTIHPDQVSSRPDGR